MQIKLLITKGHLFKFIICISTIVNIANVYAQAPLKKGDRLPDNKLKSVYNARKGEIDLSTIKAKLILLDFWSPNCTGCLTSFPKLDSLQKLFGKDISIILVNEQSLDSTKRFFDQRKFLYKPEIPFVTGDIVLNRLFPNLAKPAYAWLDGDGKFYQMTNSLTGEGIRKFMLEQKSGLDEYLGRQRYLPSLFDQEFKEDLLSYSYLAKAIPGVSLAGEGDGRRISVPNYTILELYKEAYNEIGKYDFGKPWKISLAVKDSSRYILPANSDLAYEWRKENTYTYSLLLPKEGAADRFKTMQKDLDRYFGIESNVEKRMVKYLALVRTSANDKLKSKRRSKFKAIDPHNFIMSSHGQANKYYPKRELIAHPYQVFSRIFKVWVERRLKQPFVDQTGYAGDVSISISGDVVDRFELLEIKTALRAYDLDLVEKEYLIDVLVLKE